MEKVLVIYHGDCLDGISGAWAAWKKFGSKAEYFAASRERKLPDVKGREVYCIDFTPSPAAVVKKMARDAVRLTLIDHHITAKPLVELAPEFWFSLEHSAATLAWEYFHPGKPVPHLLRYVEDGDLWRFKLPHSRAVRAYLEIFNLDFKTWDKLVREFETAAGRREAIRKGMLLLTHKQAIVGDIADNARLVRFEGRSVLAANSPVFESELGNLLARKKPPFGIVWREENGMIRVSLRAVGNFDVAKIAQKYGGGGHTAASGFSFPRGKKSPWA